MPRALSGRGGTGGGARGVGETLSGHSGNRAVRQFRLAIRLTGSLSAAPRYRALLKFMWVRNWLKGLQEAQ